ncbi:MAG: DUF1697 domain-containing protein [Acidobacteriota bacterium]
MALLRAINVGGTGKFPMTVLRELCESCGFQDVTTYIQSGNVVFRSRASATTVKKRLEKAIRGEMGRSHQVLVRDAEEWAGVQEAAPFPGAKPNQVLVVFLDDPPEQATIAETTIPGREEMVAVGRELYVHFPDGMGRSKLRVPFQDVGTGRNLNTVNKLASLLEKLA